MSLTSRTTNFPHGATNARHNQTFGMSGVQDPSWSQLYHNEFNNFAATDFTQSGVGAPTYSLSASLGPGGVVTLNASNGTADSANLFQPVGSFQFIQGKHQFFKARLYTPVGQLNAAIYAGLTANAASAVAANDGLFIYKAAGQVLWWLRSIVGGAITDTPLPAACVAPDQTWIEVGFHVDDQNNVEIFWNPTTGTASPAPGGFRGRVAMGAQLNLTQALLAVCVGVINASATARTLGVDFLTVSSER
jgi:hypothetical protein